MSPASAFTGRARAKQTKWQVRFFDASAKWIITVFGIGTIVAVSTVALFLVAVVAPLLLPATLSERHEIPIPGTQPIRIGVDEYQVLGWSLTADGKLVGFRLDNGKELESRQLFENKTITAASFSVSSESVTLGFNDGTVVFGEIGFRTAFLDHVPEQLKGLAEGEYEEYQGTIAQRISGGQIRTQQLHTKFATPIDAGLNSPIKLLDHTEAATEATGRMHAVLTEDGRALLYRVFERTNMLTGAVIYDRRECVIPYQPRQGAKPEYLALPALGDSVMLIWKDGHLARYSTLDFANPTLLEEVQLTDEGRTLTVFQWLLGRATILVGDSGGAVSALFAAIPTEDKDSDEPVGQASLVKAHVFQHPGSPVSAIATSRGMRLIAIGHDNGDVDVLHVTSHKQLADLNVGKAVENITFSPKDDGLLVAADGTASHWEMDVKHPETTLASLFDQVWYESRPGPEWTWQSSSAEDDFEPKLSLVPCIFGTIKATFFSLLLGVPIALLAAIYTSEFLHPKLKTYVKPTVEMMASLPSVVLGFLAALVFAPVVAKYLPEFLVAFLTVPAAFLFGAYLWQFIPQEIVVPYRRLRLICQVPCLVLGIILAALLGRPLEILLFHGDIIRWLDGQIGSAFGGWVLLAFPWCLFLVAWAFTVYLGPWLRGKAVEWTQTQCAVADVLRFAAGLVATVALSCVIAGVLTGIGIDVRGGMFGFGRFDQRNAVVVGFVMGFAVIPIIYTIAEDALSAVPEHLRSASLGAGATPWQTAVRIVVPTAMSGLFSAIMVGLGRAVGETMIVLMALGSTPVMEMNPFNGARTLSANIAIELPEAVRDSTHYRTLFLAALTLFVMTFILNTVAELVRMRFRKRAGAL